MSGDGIDYEYLGMFNDIDMNLVYTKFDEYYLVESIKRTIYLDNKLESWLRI